MKKKVLSMFLVAAMTASMVVGCGGGNGDSGDGTEGGSGTSSSKKDDKTITIWVADEVTEFTKTQAETFLASSDEYKDWKVQVESVGEGDAAGNVITDVQGAADIFGFAQDQVTRLISAGGLTPLSDENAAWVKEQNDANSLSAVTVGDKVYAYPMTADNGYFLYYDSSVVTDPTSLEQILADCEAAGKNFYFDVESGWYQPAFFFATGCTCEYETDDAGKYIDCTMDYASANGIVAMREMIDMVSSSAWRQGSSLSSATDVGAIVDGTWDSSAAKKMLGDNFACSKLPSFTGSDGNTYQMKGFTGYKLMGVKPQENADKLKVCTDLVKFLTGAEVQLARYQELGWGPSNLEAQQDSAVQEDVALTALRDQMQYMVPQGQYPDGYWDPEAKAFGSDIEGKEKYSASSADEELMAALQAFQDKCISYAEQ